MSDHHSSTSTARAKRDAKTSSKRSAGTIFASTGSRYYPIIVALFASMLLISNISATKGVTLGPVWGFPINTDGGFLLYPLSYVLGDVLSEVYGFKNTRKAIYLGFGICVGALLYFRVVLWLPGADYYTDEAAFKSVLWQSTGSVILASMAGYLVGQLLNALTVVKMKKWTDGRHLWARLLGSTVVAEFADTLVFCLIAAPVIGFHSFSDIAIYTVLGFFYKVLVESAVLPVSMRAIGWLKRHEPTYALNVEAAAKAK